MVADVDPRIEHHSKGVAFLDSHIFFIRMSRMCVRVRVRMRASRTPLTPLVCLIRARTRLRENSGRLPRRRWERSQADVLLLGSQDSREEEEIYGRFAHGRFKTVGPGRRWDVRIYRDVASLIQRSDTVSGSLLASPRRICVSEVYTSW